MPKNDPAVAHILADIATCRAALAAGHQVSGRRARSFILPPADEDPDPAGRIAMCERWLRRWAPGVLEEEERHADAA